MTIGEFLECLKTLPPKLEVSNVNLEDYGSDRGDYYEFYIGEGCNSVCVVKDIIDLIENKVLNKTFTGYKGGDFTMDENSEIRLGMYGCSGSEIGGILLTHDYCSGVRAIIKPIKTFTY